MSLFALLFIGVLFVVHVYARIFIAPTIEQSTDDCKDPNKRPGSRAERYVLAAGTS